MSLSVLPNEVGLKCCYPLHSIMHFKLGMQMSYFLFEKSENEMMKIRNLGRKSLKEVMDKIKDMGLSFRNDD